MNKKRSTISVFNLASLLRTLVILGMVFAPGVNRTLAQEVNPPTATPQPVGYGAVVPMEQQAADSQPAATSVADENTEQGDGNPSTESPASETQPALQAVEPLPTRNTGMQAMQINSPNAPEVQGVVLLDVSVPDTTSAGETLTYTYRYSNTSAFPVNNVVVDASWSNFTGATQQQKCYDTGCPAIFVDGPAVITTTPPNTANMRYVIGTLVGNQSGSFSVIMRIDAADYPKTGQAIARPAGSGKLYLDNNFGTLISDDTANTMIVGPALVLTKTATSVTPIYTGQSAEFNIRLGNASAAGDQVGGSIRADARLGTNVVLKDSYPKGADFVSATGPYVKDDISRIVTWTFASLAVGSFQDLKVVFRKVDSIDDCTTLDNDSYEATSDEYPFQSVSKRYVVKGAIASVPVVPPLQTPYITPTVSSLYYGNDTIITITVRNHYTAALTGVVMKYVLPENLGYVEPITGSTLISVPATALGGEVGWRFDMPAAATKTIPSIKLFAIRARAAFFKSTQASRASIVESGNISLPLACAFKVGGPDVKPRVKAVKTTDLQDRKSIYENAYYVTRNEDFPYVITITNRSVVPVVGLTLTDTLPGKAGEPDANLSYIPGSGTLDGAPREPDDVINGYAGKLIWRNLSIPANGYIVLRYQLNIDGRDYYKYCNTIAVGFGTTEDAEYGNSGEKGICVKINPNIRMYKVAFPTVAGPGEEVQFLLSLTNNEAIPYTAGLYDKLNAFTFIRQVSGYAQPFTSTYSANSMEWPLVTLNPGDVISAVIVARMPDEACAQTKYDNEIEFNMITQGASAHFVGIIPYKVPVQCAAIEYRKTADRSSVSLRDVMTFTLTLKNINPSDAVTNVKAIDLLPAGFSYVGMSPLSDLFIVPTQTVGADGRSELTWDLATIAGGQTRNLRFYARTSDTVGSFENWLTQSSPVSGRCLTSCRTVTETGVSKIYYYTPVTVLPLNTIAPQVLETTCARPGDTRTYRLTMVNTNVHSYENITITVALPMGLRFGRAISNTTAPQLIAESNGTQTVRWVGQRINAKPSGVFAAQVEYWMELTVGNVLGNLPTVATAISADGLIPRKDDATDPTVPICAPTMPTMVKAVNQPQVTAGGEVVYQISLANPTGSPINTTVGDPLPGSFSYVAMVSGPEPVANGNTLSWNNVSVPAAGLTNLIFRVQSGGATGETYTNIAQSSLGLDAVNATANVFLAAPLSNLTGVVFNDSNDNGLRDGAEIGIANATVTLTQSSGSVVTQTNAQGAYGFYGLLSGSFAVRVGPRPNLVNTNPQSVSSDLTAGATTNVDFGFGVLPTISINDVSVNEGNSGTTAMVFTVTLSRPAIAPVMVGFTTANGTAIAPGDYAANSGTATIAVGATNAQVTVQVNGDAAYEPNETLLVNLSAPVNAAIADGQGQGTIVNDDPVVLLPQASIVGAEVLEGSSGSTSATFTVTLSKPATATVTIPFTTVDGTAIASSDYTAKSGSLTIAPGGTTGTIVVQVNGDTTYELDESFSVQLGTPSNAQLLVSKAQGLILNDDLPSTSGIVQRWSKLRSRDIFFDYRIESVARTAYGGYVLAGRDADNTILQSGSGAHITKVDQFGDVTWSRYISLTSLMVIQSIVATVDGGSLLVGIQESQPRLIRLNASGDVVWQRTYAYPDWEAFEELRMVLTSDGNYVFAGKKIVVSVNDSGDVSWAKRFPSMNLRNVAAGSGGAVLVVGKTDLSGELNIAVAMLLNSQGAVTWQKQYAASGSDKETDFFTGVRMLDGSYILGGNVFDVTQDKQAKWLVKVSPAGVVQWAKTFQYGAFTRLLALVNGHVIAVGANYLKLKIGGGGTSFYIYPIAMKLDASGAIVWQHFYANSGQEYQKTYSEFPELDAALATDGGFIMTFRGASFNWVYKLDSDGLAGTACPTITAMSETADASTALMTDLGTTPEAISLSPASNLFPSFKKASTLDLMCLGSPQLKRLVHLPLIRR